jgi:hypothetical protein
LFLISIIKFGREDDDLSRSVVSCLEFNEKKYFYNSSVPSPDLKCYSIFCFESRSGVFVFLVLDLCAGPEAVFFSRRRCVSGTGSFTGPIFA